MDFRNRKIDLVGKQNLWFGISAVILFIGLASLAIFGMNYGIDFKGGGQLKYLIPQAQRPVGGEAQFINGAREALAPKGLDNAKIQITGGDTLVIVTNATDSAGLASQERIISSSLATQLGAQPQVVSRELVGPVIGKELKKNALIGVILGVLLIALWIYIRYNFAGDGSRYAVAGIIALVHDVFVLIGLFALIGHFWPSVEVDGAFIAALLTVVGYSINDSVVIFDRIRENLRKRRNENFNHVVNDSLLETMSRSINTGLTVIIMLLVMYFFGGDSIHNFILAMLIGICTGLYSSIFNASMVLVAWNNWETKKLGALRPAYAGSTPASATRTAAPKAVAPKVVAPKVSSNATRALPDSDAVSESSPTFSSETPARTTSTSASTKARARKRF